MKGRFCIPETGLRKGTELERLFGNTRRLFITGKPDPLSRTCLRHRTAYCPGCFKKLNPGGSSEELPSLDLRMQEMNELPKTADESQKRADAEAEAAEGHGGPFEWSSGTCYEGILRPKKFLHDLLRRVRQSFGKTHSMYNM